MFRRATSYCGIGKNTKFIFNKQVIDTEEGSNGQVSDKENVCR